MITKQKQIERENQIAAASLGYASEICKDRVLGKYIEDHFTATFQENGIRHEND